MKIFPEGTYSLWLGMCNWQFSWWQQLAKADLLLKFLELQHQVFWESHRSLGLETITPCKKLRAKGLRVCSNNLYCWPAQTLFPCRSGWFICVDYFPQNLPRSICRHHIPQLWIHLFWFGLGSGNYLLQTSVNTKEGTTEHHIIALIIKIF